MATTTRNDREQILDEVKSKFGFVPNLLDNLSQSPAAARVYLGGMDALATGNLRPAEVQAVALAISGANECHYCTAAHGTVAKSLGISAEDVTALKSGGEVSDAALASVADATRLLWDKRGWLTPEDLQALEARGIDRPKLYEIVALVGLKVLSNFVNHIEQTPVDAAFAAEAAS